MAVHKVYRNGRLYYSLDNEHYAILSYARGLSEDRPHDLIEVRDENGELYYVCGPKTKE